MQVAFRVVRQRIVILDLDDEEYNALKAATMQPDFDMTGFAQESERGRSRLEDDITEQFEEGEMLTIDGIELATDRDLEMLDAHPSRIAMVTEAIDNAIDLMRHE